MPVLITCFSIFSSAAGIAYFPTEEWASFAYWNFILEVINRQNLTTTWVLVIKKNIWAAMVSMIPAQKQEQI